MVAMRHEARNREFNHDLARADLVVGFSDEDSTATSNLAGYAEQSSQYGGLDRPIVSDPLFFKKLPLDVQWHATESMDKATIVHASVVGKKNTGTEWADKLNTLQGAIDYMDMHGFHSPLLVARPDDLRKLARAAVKIGINPVVTDALLDGIETEPGIPSHLPVWRRVAGKIIGAVRRS